MRFEKKVKKQLKSEIGKDRNPNSTLYERIGINMSLNKKEKRRNYVPLISVLTAFVVVLVVGLVIVGNSKIDNSYNAVVKMDVNPSIEFVVDEKNKVLSVNGLNDEGKMIVCGETVVNKDLDDAIEMIVKLEIDLGYITNGDENKITFTVSAKSDDIINNIIADAKESATNTLDKLGITAKIESAKGYTKEELGKLAKELDPTLTDEEIANLTYNQLVNVVRLYHLEVADFATVKLEEYYKKYRDYEIALSEKEYVKNAISTADSTYKALLVSYSEFISNLEGAYTNIQNDYYNLFINSESEYQKAWANLATLKEAYLVQKNIVDNLPEGDLSLIEEKIKLEKARLGYETAETTLKAIESTSELSYNVTCQVFETIIESLKNLEKSLPTEIASITIREIENTDDKLNAYKKNICDEFEKEFADDIANMKQMMLDRKQELRNSLHTNNQ